MAIPSAYVPQIITFPGAPTGVCDLYQMALNVSNGDLYTCDPATRGWVQAGGSGGTGAPTFTVTANASNFTAAVGTFHRVTTGGSTITVTLPSAVGITGQEFEIKKVDAGAGTIALSGTIDGATGWTINNQFQYMRLMSNGTAFEITANN